MITQILRFYFYMNYSIWLHCVKDCSGNPFIFSMAIEKIKDCSEKPDPTFSGGARPKKPQSSSQTFLSFQAKMTFDDSVVF